VLFDDGASGTIINYDQDINSQVTLRPEGYLSVFKGFDSQGTWTLHICDDEGVDDGTFNEANLIVDYVQNEDTDNDGIPDNVEAQGTSGYTGPSGIDTNGDGLDDNYDTDNGGTAVTVPDTDTDTDGIADFLDSDSDNDGYSDCEEGLDPDSFSVSCPVNTANVGTNGLVDWADNGDDYTNVSGVVTIPSTDLFNETGNNSEVAYREFLCGKALITLTHDQWRLISFPCDTGNISVMDLLGTSLGTTYETDWEIWEQDASDNWEVNASHKNTVKRKLAEGDSVLQGQSYWIIIDAGGAGNTKSVTIPKTLSGLSPTTLKDANDTTIDITDSDFTQVHQHTLPDNIMSQTGNVKKYMAGNPFPYAFHLINLYFSHGGGGGSYHSMDDNASNGDYINPTFYKHDSSEVGSVVGYTAVNADTSGFDDGGIQPMEGFFIKIEENADQGSNAFAFPLIIAADPLSRRIKVSPGLCRSKMS